ncbi:MAG TPA: cytochrome b/b6 domain-containing protein [Usitatibacter sp.]|jgi:cytochrome b|nr:cytochrome b/b6 domain-containing protein [Usitatibacter sp.]
MARARIRVWDLPTRIFHWTLALLALFSFTTGKVGGGWMAWHLGSGYAILALLLFRLAWGVVGSTTARFTHFLRGPRAAVAYGRTLLATRRSSHFGHNPLGGLMVLSMLAGFLLQAVTGLFSDDEISTQGPLAAKVSDALVSRMSALHSYNEWVLAALVGFHVMAIAIYAGAFRASLVGPMVVGWRAIDAGDAVPSYRAAPAWRAAIVLAFAAGFVYWLVVVFPRG